MFYLVKQVTSFVRFIPHVTLIHSTYIWWQPLWQGFCLLINRLCSWHRLFLPGTPSIDNTLILGGHVAGISSGPVDLLMSVGTYGPLAFTGCSKLRISGWYSDGGFLISIEIGSKSMLSRCCCQLVYLHERSHDILQRYIGFDRLLSTVASWNLWQVISWGRLTIPGLTSMFMVLQWFHCEGFLGHDCFSSCRLSASLDVGSMRTPLFVEVTLIFDSVGGLCFLHSAFYRLGLSTAEFGGHRRGLCACQLEGNSWWSCSG